jgi:hypothetical protein
MVVLREMVTRDQEQLRILRNRSRRADRAANQQHSGGDLPDQSPDRVWRAKAETQRDA